MRLNLFTNARRKLSIKLHVSTTRIFSKIVRGSMGHLPALWRERVCFRRRLKTTKEAADERYPTARGLVSKWPFPPSPPQDFPQCSIAIHSTTKVASRTVRNRRRFDTSTERLDYRDSRCLSMHCTRFSQIKFKFYQIIDAYRLSLFHWLSQIRALRRANQIGVNC